MRVRHIINILTITWECTIATIISKYHHKTSASGCFAIPTWQMQCCKEMRPNQYFLLFCLFFFLIVKGIFFHLLFFFLTTVRILLFFRYSGTVTRSMTSGWHIYNIGKIKKGYRGKDYRLISDNHLINLLTANNFLIKINEIRFFRNLSLYQGPK